MAAKKILITGASGFLGYHLLRTAHARGFDVYGLYNSGKISFEYSTNLQLDLRNYIDMGNVIDDIEPDAVIHAAALADATLCQKNKELSYEINVEVTRNLAGICSDYQVPFVFTSTDLVFDGEKGNYTESDIPNPIMVYGAHKLEAEQKTAKVYPESLIVRCPLMFGAIEASDKTYFSTFIRGMREGKPANVFHDEYRSICGARSVSEGILHLCEEATGLFHLGGTARVSRYDFGMAAAEAFGLDKTLIHSLSQKDIQMSVPRPADVSLNIQKARSFGYSPLGYQEELRHIAAAKYL
ncbi:MAG: dTDP-4-dehydrorhamnose reductase [Bacteroidetes bacterium]|nr:dTDP-4-dehydrorhamnose reductase [Bacteroidota bacterium]